MHVVKNQTLQKLSSSKCAKGFSDIFNHFRRSCEALSVKEKVTGADFRFLVLNIIMKSLENQTLTDFRPPRFFLKNSVGENALRHFFIICFCAAAR